MVHTLLYSVSKGYSTSSPDHAKILSHAVSDDADRTPFLPSIATYSNSVSHLPHTPILLRIWTKVQFQRFEAAIAEHNWAIKAVWLDPPPDRRVPTPWPSPFPSGTS